MIKGHLKIIVLSILNKAPKSGYGLMKELQNTIGQKPSPGSIYPLLDSLLKEKKVTVKKLERKKLYTLTNEGKNELILLKNKKQEFIQTLISSFKMLELLTGKKETMEIINKIQ